MKVQDYVFRLSQTSDLFLTTIGNIGKIVRMGEEARNEKTERQTLIKKLASSLDHWPKSEEK